MRRIAWVLGCLLVASAVTNGGERPVPAEVEFSAGAWVEVDATGKAHVLEMDGFDRLQSGADARSLAGIINARLRERIESWQFEPPTRNGIAVSGRTHVNLAVVAGDDGSGNIRLRLKRANTGLVLRRMPSFVPVMSEMGKAAGWTAVVHLEISPAGLVTDARVVDFKVFDGRQFVSRPGYHSLSRAAVRIIRQAEFEMERVEGKPIAGRGDLPIQMCLSGSAACSDVAAREGGDKADERHPRFAAANPAIGLRTAVANTLL